MFEELETILVRYTVYATNLKGHTSSVTFTNLRDVEGFMELNSADTLYFRVLKTEVSRVW